MIRISVDFNRSTSLLPLNFRGAIRDIQEQKVELREGLAVVLYMEDLADAVIVEKNGEWWARVTSDLRHIPYLPKDLHDLNTKEDQKS